MPGHIKVSGTWRSVTRPSVRVSGTWRNAVQGWVRVGGSWVVWFLAAITDTFNRSDTVSSLGTTSSGQSWTNVRGTWYVSSNQAKSDTAASSYALASVPLGSQNSITSASVSNGVGPAFWITDSNNWWASHGHSVSTTTSTCTGPTTSCTDSTNTCSPGGCGSVTSTNACTGATVSCTDSNNTCSPGGCGTVTSTTNTSFTYLLNDGGSCPSGYTSVNCSEGGSSCGTPCGTGGFVCCRATVTTYTRTQNTLVYTRTQNTTQSSTTITHFLRIISSVGGTVSTATGDVSLASAAAAVKVVTSGNTITSYAYSDTAMNTQIGTSTVTPSSPTRGTSTGIVKAISSHQQGSTADNFSSEAG